MTAIYLIDEQGVLHGPVALPDIPGYGPQSPGNALTLTKALPAAKTGHVWHLVGNKPVQIEDNRGTVYRLPNGEPESYWKLGALPSTLTRFAPPSPAHSWVDGAWTLTLSQLHASKTAAVNSACTAGITGGYWSSALGAPHRYGSALDEQLNLSALMLSDADGMYPCRDEQGVTAFRSHSSAQLHQVADDFTRFKLTWLQQANGVKRLLDIALADADRAAMDAITWTPPA